MSRLIDLTGQRFGSLKVIKWHPRKTKGCHNSQWLCRCDCGNFLIVRSDNLRSGRSNRCSKCRGTGGVRSVFVKEVMEDGVV